ncbi:DUF5999 family protein [Streptomyces atacamensis]|uniref:DUF5999 family protein n=1 Tax=Streptomyces atacamensis TaxID=531966 RepID=UPI00399C983F
MCRRTPTCPSAEAAIVIVAHRGQAWSQLCNGVLLFEGSGGILPNDRITAPRRLGWRYDERRRISKSQHAPGRLPAPYGAAEEAMP